VVKKREARFDAGFPLPIQIERDGNAGFFGFAFDRCLAKCHVTVIKSKPPPKNKAQLPV
jgi:hypothetical protein